MARRAAHRRFWWRSLLAVAPALLLAGAVPFLTRSSDRILAALLAFDAFYVFAAFVHPRLASHRDTRLAEVAHRLLDASRDVTDSSNVVDLLAQLLRDAGIADRLVVVISAADRKLELYGGLDADTDVVAELGGGLFGADDAEPAMERLRRALGCNLIVPLRTRRETLGVAFARTRPRAPRDACEWESLGAHLAFLLAERALAEILDGVERTLSLGMSVQTALMPAQGTEFAARVTYHSIMRLTPYCGGDTWTARELGGDKLLIFVGDATGHGPAAATIAVAAKAVVDGMAMVHGPDLRLDRLLGEVDRVVRRLGGQRYLMSAIAAVIDVKRGELAIANAGHPRPFVVEQRDTQRMITLAETGTGNLLGAGEVHVELRTLPLTPGSRWVFFTDGLSEASTARGFPYGLRRFRDALERAAPGSVRVLAEAVFADVVQFAGGRPFEDDVILVVAEVPAAAPGDQR